jgi:hypothetical protein
MSHPSPRTAINALAAGHTVWGLIAYRRDLPAVVRGLPGSVGDGIFNEEHSRDGNAAGFWFMFAGPMLALFGRMYESAEAADDREAMLVAGRAVTAMSLAGWAAIPASGFPGGLALGLWLTRRARR